jgi:acetylornithine deacetylase/succinyl-diaminopimelate desuccinylase-like protein
MSKDFEKVKDESYNPPHSTINFGRIEQGSGNITLHFDMRLLPDLDPEAIEQHIQEGMRKIASRYSQLNVSASRDRGTPGLNMTMEHELVKHCKEAMEAAGIPPQFDKKATATEAAQYFQAGYEAVIFGPGKSHGNSHSPNEHNLLEQIDKATLFYEKLIEKVCL